MTMQLEFLDSVSHVVAVDPEQLAGMRLVARGPLERLDDELPLDLLQLHALGRQLELYDDPPIS